MLVASRETMQHFVQDLSFMALAGPPTQAFHRLPLHPLPLRSSSCILQPPIRSPSLQRLSFSLRSEREVSLDKPASDVVREFYARINRRDMEFLSDLIAEDCVYEDLVFPRPFVGRQAILEFFSKFTNAVGSDLQFVIDDISKDDPVCVGATWHLEWRGKPFPFSKGCSFYRLTVSNGKRQIIYGRDSVEPAVKPGGATLVIIKAVVALLRKFPNLADRF